MVVICVRYMAMPRAVVAVGDHVLNRHASLRLMLAPSISRPIAYAGPCEEAQRPGDDLGLIGFSVNMRSLSAGD